MHIYTCTTFTYTWAHTCRRHANTHMNTTHLKWSKKSLFLPCVFCKCTIKFVALTWKAVLLWFQLVLPTPSYACLQCALAYMSYAHVHPSLYLMKLVLSLNPELTDPSKSGQLAPGFPDSAFPRSQRVLFSCGFWGSDLWSSFLQGESFIHGAISLALIYICPLYKANYFHMLKIYYKNLLFTSCLFLVIQWSSKLQVQLFFRLIFFVL